MAEWIEIETLKYHLRCRLVVRGETWEFWQGFREIAMLRYKTAQEVIDFDGEWLGWDHVLKLYFQLQIPAEVEIGGRRLEESEVDSLAAQIHFVLCSMKQRNAVVRKIPWPPWPKWERDRLLQEFQHWMGQRGWSVTVNRADEKISIKRRGLRFIRPKPTETDIIAQGAWVAKGWHAMLDKEIGRTVLFVSEGARQTSSWLAELTW